LGAIGCFSFFPSKNLGAFGDAGMCVTRDATLAERLAILRAHGGHSRYLHGVVGGNFRLDALQAAVLLVKLDHLEDWTARRRRHAARYTQRFAAASDRMRTPAVRDGYRHVFNQYVIRLRDRDGLRAHLTACGVGTATYYPLSLHMQACFAHLGYQAGDLPESEAAARETLALPVYPELSAEQQEHVVRSVLDYVRRAAPGDDLPWRAAERRLPAAGRARV
jgi:dTDP-4-amino-4,6-dideoxygalactose transaminase